MLHVLYISGRISSELAVLSHNVLTKNVENVTDPVRNVDR
jgi:hypothetical protein